MIYELRDHNSSGEGLKEQDTGNFENVVIGLVV